jgi:hypothetical protein
VLIVAVVYLIRFALALMNWEFLAEILPFSPAYLAVSGLVWGMALPPLAWGLWRGRSWARGGTLIALLVFSFYYWFDRLLMPSYSGRNVNWLFSAGVNLLFLAWSWWILSRPRARTYFGELHEREPENPRVA